MGACWSCCRYLLGYNNSSSNDDTETEMVSKKSKDKKKLLGIQKDMSSPHIQILSSPKKSGNATENGSSAKAGTKVSGYGLALTGISVEQDCAYWEWHIEKKKNSDGTSGDKKIENESEGEQDENAFGAFGDEDDNFFEDESETLKFGVATKKTKAFYKSLEAAEEGEDVPIEDDGTSLMRSVPTLQDGDTVGVAVQQSDLPMIQLFLNGEPLHHLAINRFRGTVYPAIYLPPSNVLLDGSEDDGGSEGTFSATAVFKQDQFKELAPHARFGPLIAARGII
eukprot:CAMPEP_0178976596 /NCGR_PEP_ID=MMETSP0789-20121207/23935_1 /TAXON_ID=3005 /ORGANISM="Rhizosolenia setigera, Strain CCMP 1694" /LENGTH=280 /DNA_ID=CAMNT_0020665729 /DNA_START=14 /DNA_END=856 /DNA_ORIENTATION=+